MDEGKVAIDKIELIPEALRAVGGKTVTNIVIDSTANLVFEKEVDFDKIVRQLAGSAGSEAAAMVLFPVAVAALAGAPALTVVLVGGAAYLLVSYAGSEAGKAVYDVLRLGAESLSTLLAGSDDTSGSDPLYRGYTQESDGTITMYETYLFGNEMRVYTTRSDLFNRVISRSSFVPESFGLEVPYNLMTLPRHEGALENFKPRRIALAGRDGQWYALDLQRKTFFTVDPEQGRIVGPHRFGTAEAWAEAFGPGQVETGEDLVGIVTQDGTVDLGAVAGILEGVRPETPEEVAREALLEAQARLISDSEGRRLTRNNDKEVERLEQRDVNVGTYHYWERLRYDPETQRFERINTDRSFVPNSVDDRRGALPQDPGSDRHAALDGRAQTAAIRQGGAVPPVSPMATAEPALSPRPAEPSVSPEPAQPVFPAQASATLYS